MLRETRFPRKYHSKEYDYNAAQSLVSIDKEYGRMASDRELSIVFRIIHQQNMT